MLRRLSLEEELSSSWLDVSQLVWKCDIRRTTAATTFLYVDDRHVYLHIANLTMTAIQVVDMFMQSFLNSSGFRGGVIRLKHVRID
jgi:hypothetical protein